jgi:hypothetical protein
MILPSFFKMRVGFAKPCADRCDESDHTASLVRAAVFDESIALFPNPRFLFA